MRWTVSYRADSECLPLADRHYNRQSVGSPQFVPPGRCVVLKCTAALWVTSWPFAEYVNHAWAGAWVNSLFRNEGAGLSSELIREAISCTLSFWPVPPSLGLVTFVDPSKIRQKRDPGYCYLQAGFHPAKCPMHVDWNEGCAACESRTQSGLLAFQMFPHEMPEPMQPRGVPRDLPFDVAV